MDSVQAARNLELIRTLMERTTQYQLLTARAGLAAGSLAGAGALWGTRAYLRSRRRIDLDGRVVIVTGASSGLGLLIARRAAERGARLVLAVHPRMLGIVESFLSRPQDAESRQLPYGAGELNTEVRQTPVQ